VVSQPDQCLTLIGRETTVVDEVRAVLFGLEGFEILDAVETSGGELVVRVETIDPVLGCPACGTRAGRSRGRPWVRLRDVSSAGRRVQVWWRKRRHECPDSDCDRRSFTEQHPAVGARRRSSLRCRVWIAGQVGPQGRAVTAVTGEVGVSWPTGMRAVHEAADLLMITTRSRPTRHLGVDETAFRRRHRWVTNIADLECERSSNPTARVRRKRQRVGWLSVCRGGLGCRHPRSDVSLVEPVLWRRGAGSSHLWFR
jgi:transposase